MIEESLQAGWTRNLFYRRVTDTIQAYEDTYLTLKSVEVINANFIDFTNFMLSFFRWSR